MAVVRAPLLKTRIMVAVLPEGDGPRLLREGAGRLRRLLRGSEHRTAWLEHRWIEKCRTAVVLTGLGTHAVTPDEIVVVGLPFAQAGPATHAHMRAFVQRPTPALTGHFVAVSIGEERVRVVTSGLPVHGLTEVRNGPAVCWSNSTIGAHALLDRPARLARDRIHELVALGYVLGDEGLFADGRLLPDASLIDISAGHVDRSVWLDSADIYPVTGGPPTTPAGLRKALGDSGRPLPSLPNVQLGLSSGRDSVLLASCLDENGQAMPAYTLDGPDVPGASAVAAELGWKHQIVRARPESVDPAFPPTAAAWTDGLGLGRNLLSRGGGLDVDASTDEMAWVSGSGGEIGRAYYWEYSDDPPRTFAQARDLLLGFVRYGLPLRREAELMLAERIADALDRSAKLCRGAFPDALDVLYLRERMRKWLARASPFAPFGDLIPAYLSPGVITALISIPVERRRDGRFFDEAIALHRPQLQTARLSGAPTASRDAQLLDPFRSRLERRIARHRNPDLRTLDRTTRALGDAFLYVREALGDDYWNAVRKGATTDPNLRRRAWHAVGAAAIASHTTLG